MTSISLLQGMKAKTTAAIVVAACIISSMSASAVPPAPGRFANCEVLSYATSQSGTAKKHGLLSASPSVSAETEETWVVRSAANSNLTFAVRQTRLTSGGITLCAYTPNRVLVTLSSGRSYNEFKQEMSAKGFVIVRRLMTNSAGNSVYIVETADSQFDVVEAMSASIQSTGMCDDIAPDYLYELNAVPNDSRFAEQ